ncbi:hypothetical protein ASF58_23360 [Methylobacterium sp. Leaf125]|uniref:zinc-finger-containing protein n=1 Tax=Methylobacterium sp. Leaf125 TaxID=1736265 RepID=UPI0006FC3277|nr:zinc-finger-containing protein [Methylobacterium sp. Leaf125]KQQ39082.1 hypothetical protein ASF58_23360 [Methylobacterium sp. Leaf125]
MMPPFCPACGVAARLTNGAEVYPNCRELADRPIWKCEVCPDAYVGCHQGTKEPLGTPAGPELRKARIILHRDMVDPLWQEADRSGEYHPENESARKLIRHAARGRVYAYLAAGLDLTRDECHVAMFSLEQCREAWHCLRGVTYADVRRWAKARPEVEKKPKKPKKPKADVPVKRGGRRNLELPEPTEAERGAAAIAALALRAALSYPEAWGQQSTIHIDYSRPRRAEWVTTWSELPGLTCINGAYLHDLLPGWQYTRAELELEMAPDLEALAEHGIRPTVATSKAA